MPIDPSSFKAPYIDQHQCWAEADTFRQQFWPSQEVPIDVLASCPAFEKTRLRLDDSDSNGRMGGPMVGPAVR